MACDCWLRTSEVAKFRRSLAQRFLSPVSAGEPVGLLGRNDRRHDRLEEASLPSLGSKKPDRGLLSFNMLEPMGLRGRLHRLTDRLLVGALTVNSNAEQHGFQWTFRKGIKKFLTSRRSSPVAAALESALLRGGAAGIPELWTQLDSRQNPDLVPLQTYSVPADGESYTSIVTDSIGRSSLFGGVGTALILGTLLANRRQQPLRIITRTEPASADAYGALIKTHGLHLDAELVLAYAPAGSGRLVVSHHPDDLFLTTSWWTTASCLARLPVTSLLYLLQEDERYFYPHGDQRLNCERVLTYPGLRFVVNSRLLWQHFGESGLASIQDNGSWFDPCFKVQQRTSDTTLSPRDKKIFFFYARPRNPRNLYRIGMQAINEALCNRVLDPSEWQIVLAGSCLEPVRFDDGTVPQLVEGLSWSDYLSLLRSVDLGLSLMATPHPSYPPLDLAASGAVVVTNKFGNKTSLSSYSDNILMCDPNPDSIVETLRMAAERVSNPQQIQAAIANQSFCQSWVETFSPLLENCARV